MTIDCQDIWTKCLANIRSKIGEQGFTTWFKPILPVKIEGKILTIQVPSQFFYEYLEEHYVHLLRNVLNDELGQDYKLEYSIVVDKGNEFNKPYIVNLPNNGKAVSKGNERSYSYTSPFDLQTIDVATRKSNLNINYTFENFIEGDCNRLARSAGLAVAQKPGVTSFNPLMLYGGVGLGKTHLVQAIGNEIRKVDEKFVLYVSSEKFTNQFFEAIKANNIQEFSNFYLQVDVLIIDDVQFFEGKEKTQEIFFHIFNHLHQNGRQIIMTSDRPPRDLAGLMERLVSRFKWGLTADLQQPDYETRMAIIQRKMQADGIDIPENVIEYLAYSIDTNVRDLEGVLISLIANASLIRREIDLELARETLKNIVHDIDSEVGIDYIQKTISEYFKIPIDQLKDKTRKKEIVLARQIAMYFAKDYTNHSLKTIGDHFGGRDHSTVIHAVQAVSDFCDTDASFKKTVEEIRKKLKLKAAS